MKITFGIHTLTLVKSKDICILYFSFSFFINAEHMEYRFILACLKELTIAVAKVLNVVVLVGAGKMVLLTIILSIITGMIRKEGLINILVINC